eukprot:270009-Lingulodinium_polyedra.AAC.1
MTTQAGGPWTAAGVFCIVTASCCARAARPLQRQRLASEALILSCVATFALCLELVVELFFECSA